MTKFNIVFLYLALSVFNGIVLSAIALLLSAPGMMVLLIWGFATFTSFALMCLLCLSCAMKDAIPGGEKTNLGREFNEVVI